MPVAPLALKHHLRELRELGVSGSAFRIGWELKRRTRFFELVDRPPARDHATVDAIERAVDGWRKQFLFANPTLIRERFGPTPGDAELAALLERARAGTRGVIEYYSDEPRNCGDPVAWHRDPVTRETASATLHWARAMSTVKGDVKDLWEMGRFPQAYAMGRAATFEPSLRPALASALAGQIRGFLRDNPFALGVHWASGQEIAFRLFAWVFALRTMLLDECDRSFLVEVAAHALDCATHISRHVDYARRATHNNHLLSEAVGLLLVAYLVPRAPACAGFRKLGLELLSEGVRHQFYRDGGYIQHAHNYHRVALHDLAWAMMIEAARAEPIPADWRDAAARSIEFLHAQQAPDGSLPNYGSNDGALVCPLSFSGYDDYRPVLQSIAARVWGERLYPPGPWDEEALWMNGSLADRAPATRPRRSRSFMPSGYHVLRGRVDGNFAVLRCGTLLDRFTQIDMLSLDVFWRGHNVIVDAGTYRYSGAPEWHAHFLGTSSHNTVMVDGENQMLHFRQFKTLYPAQATLVAFRDERRFQLCAGEHRGFDRIAPGTVHRRAVLFVPDETWIVVDTIEGSGIHDVRLQWLFGDFPSTTADGSVNFRVDTPSGPFSLAVYGQDGQPIPLDVSAGEAAPPRGWLSRRYGRKTPVPSVVVAKRSALPRTFVTVLGVAGTLARARDGRLGVVAGSYATRFRIAAGIPEGIEVFPIGELEP